MKKILSYFLLFGTICMMFSSCSKTKYRSSSMVSQENSSPLSESESYSENIEIESGTTFSFLDIDIPVTFASEILVDNVHIDWYVLIFDYKVGEFEGKANVPLSFGRLVGYNWDSPDFLDSMSLVFHYKANKPSLTVKWTSVNSNLESIDTYVLDEKLNFWYYQVEDFDIFPVMLTREDVIRFFPDETPAETNMYSTFLCDKTLYNVSFYRVSDFDNIYGPDVLMAYYEEYTNEDLFFWQTDIMFSWHLSIQYTDIDGNVHIIYYGLGNYGSGGDPTEMFKLEEPDWNTEAEGEIY